jgi:hypothetical protein
MLVQRRCPHTGGIDFYADEDPHLSIGSVYASRTGHGVLWWFHLDDDYAGNTTDLTSAERQLSGIYRDFVLRHPAGIHHHA